MLHSIETELRPLYRTSQLQWDASEKRRQLRAHDHCFIVVEDGAPRANPEGDCDPRLAFVSYRKEQEEDCVAPSACAASDSESAADKPGSSKNHTEANSKSTVAFNESDKIPARTPDNECRDSDSKHSATPSQETFSEVLYVYELFVHKRARGRGLAQYLMQSVEIVAHDVDVQRVMLTVLEANAPAMRLYTNALGYVDDESTPSKWGHLDTGYRILCKQIQTTTSAG